MRKVTQSYPRVFRAGRAGLRRPRRESSGAGIPRRARELRKWRTPTPAGRVASARIGVRGRVLRRAAGGTLRRGVGGPMGSRVAGRDQVPVFPPSFQWITTVAGRGRPGRSRAGCRRRAGSPAPAR
ncbi:hypothetical protein FRAHR75_250076 [Frankia sp. Hr75.2]|nr:hypothetical protein FRAHR75_250076 [Frankia sp. Hr75.2]